VQQSIYLYIAYFDITWKCFEMWCWRRLEKIGWTDRVRNKELDRLNEGMDILYTVRRRKVNWIGHILPRN